MIQPRDSLIGLILFFTIFFSACSWISPPETVECCEKDSACCYDQMCCLPRYARAAGKEPKSFTPEVPVYARREDVEPAPGETIDVPSFFSRLNPFAEGAGGFGQ